MLLEHYFSTSGSYFYYMRVSLLWKLSGNGTTGNCFEQPLSKRTISICSFFPIGCIYQIAKSFEVRRTRHSTVIASFGKTGYRSFDWRSPVVQMQSFLTWRIERVCASALLQPKYEELLSWRTNNKQGRLLIVILRPLPDYSSWCNFCLGINTNQSVVWLVFQSVRRQSTSQSVADPSVRKSVNMINQLVS